MGYDFWSSVVAFLTFAYIVLKDIYSLILSRRKPLEVYFLVPKKEDNPLSYVEQDDSEHLLPAYYLPSNSIVPFCLRIIPKRNLVVNRISFGFESNSNAPIIAFEDSPAFSSFKTLSPPPSWLTWLDKGKPVDIWFKARTYNPGVFTFRFSITLYARRGLNPFFVDFTLPIIVGRTGRVLCKKCGRHINFKFKKKI